MTKMPKKLSKHFLLFVLLLFGTLLISCENEEDLLEEVTPTYNEELPISIVTTTFEEAGEKFNQLSRQHHLESHMRLISFGGIEKSGSSGGIVIISEEVKEIKRGDYTSYTMLIEPKDIASNIFYNLTIEDVKGVTKLFITKYDPTDVWLENNNMRFEGQITTFRIDDLQTALDRIDTPTNGGGGGGGNTTYPTDCDGTVVATLVIEEVRCGCGDGMADNCTGCNIPPYFPYYDYKFVYECIPNTPPPNGNPFDNPPGGTPGSTDPPTGGGPGGGSGAGTTPTSPAGNDPSLTAPIPPKVGGGTGPCGELKKVANSYNYSHTINHLKLKATGPKEHAWVYKYNPSGTTFAAPTVAGHNTNNPNTVNLNAFYGNEWIGAFHNHTQGPKPTIKMFSADDLQWLFGKARRRNNSQPPSLSSEGINEFFLGLVNENEVYCLKIKDWYKFYYGFKDNYVKIKSSLDLAYKISSADAEASQTTLQKDFLKVLKEFDLGVGLYQQEENADWKELNLDPTNPDNIPTKTPCK